jgi:phosphopantothenoylcysteine decarboxylase/phosphopantothenate--cysteine ligase
MTKAAQDFITPLSAGALAGEAAFVDLFDVMSEFDVGHIRLARDTDLIVVAPATADLVAKMANGLADDLASTVLLATDKPVLIAPAMNPRMWEHAATKRNVAQLRADGILAVGPNAGEMAERGEAGLGDRDARPAVAAAPASTSSRRRRMSQSVRCAISLIARPGGVLQSLARPPTLAPDHLISGLCRFDQPASYRARGHARACWRPRKRRSR